ncbi:hypothetical protein [Paraburkholderia sp.]|nr:hypothetical protein [Paraburkholderia sp.]
MSLFAHLRTTPAARGASASAFVTTRRVCGHALRRAAQALEQEAHHE